MAVGLTSVILSYQNCGQSTAQSGAEGASGGSAHSSGGSDSGAGESVIDAVKGLSDWKLSPNAMEFEVDVNQVSMQGTCASQEGSLLIYRLKHRDVVLHEHESWCRQGQFEVDLQPLMNLPCGAWASLEGQMGRELGELARINRRCHQPEAQFSGSLEAQKMVIETALHLEPKALGEGSNPSDPVLGSQAKADGVSLDPQIEANHCRIEKPRHSARHSCEVVCANQQGLIVRKVSFESPLCE